ncbi:MAG TPA: hypothetical protein VFI13_04500 [Gemmatimonadales bacterium]|nr:hypothetical protein [Gemmatimonadales bacterium]
MQKAEQESLRPLAVLLDLLKDGWGWPEPFSEVIQDLAGLDRRAIRDAEMLVEGCCGPECIALGYVQLN